MTTDLTYILQQLQDHDVKPSSQRIAIAKYVMEHRCHPSVDDVYNGLKEQYPTLSRTTVYNTLALLTDHGVLQEITIDSERVRYDANLDPHAHGQCVKCGRIFDYPLSAGMIAECCKVQDFRVDNVMLYLKGTCKKCLEGDNTTSDNEEEQ